jgi:hypothetical protein
VVVMRRWHVSPRSVGHTSEQQMILEMAADVGQIETNRNAERYKVIGGADTRQQISGRRIGWLKGPSCRIRQSTLVGQASTRPASISRPSTESKQGLRNSDNKHQSCAFSVHRSWPFSSNPSFRTRISATRPSIHRHSSLLLSPTGASPSPKSLRERHRRCRRYYREGQCRSLRHSGTKPEVHCAGRSRRHKVSSRPWRPGGDPKSEPIRSLP